MALFTTVLAANNANQYICDIHRRQASPYYVATIMAYGTFSSGTVEIYISPDRGTTKIPLTLAPGSPAVTFTANGMVLVNFGNISSNNQTPLTVYAGISGASSPSVTVAVYDNR